LEIVDGHAVAPSEPGLGIDWNFDAIDNLRVG
jgi:L-alanine-DL-glutamate epimerase-like enolase superfamily enzyme